MSYNQKRNKEAQYVQLDSKDAAAAFPIPHGTTNGYKVKRMRTRAVISIGSIVYIVDYADLHDPLISEIKNDTAFVGAVVDELLHRRNK